MEYSLKLPGGKEKRERRSASCLADKLHTAFVAVGNMFYNGKAKSCPTMFSASCLITAVEAFKDSFLVFGADTWTLILHTDTDGFIAAGLVLKATAQMND